MKYLSLKRSLAVMMTLALLGCASIGLASPSGEKMFNIALTAPFTGFDPLRTNDAASTYVNAQIYETLYRIAPDGSYVPLLAEALPEFAADGMSATSSCAKASSSMTERPSTRRLLSTPSA